MHVLDHLTDEHRKVETLIEQLDETEPGNRRTELVAELRSALELHMAVEERFVYPIAERALGREEVEEADIEHGLARDGLAKLEELRDKPGFGAALDMVKAGISHHVEDEESAMFPELREKATAEIAALDPDELERKIEQGDDTPPATADARAVDALHAKKKDELYKQAQAAEIPGRSSMTKDELAESLGG